MKHISNMKKSFIELFDQEATAALTFSFTDRKSVV